MKTQRHILLTLALIFAALLIQVRPASGQQLVAAAFAERNIMGFQKGMEVGYATRHAIQLTYFYQTTREITFENGSSYAFHGLSLNVPVKRFDRVDFLAGAKAGLVNGHFLAASPQLTTQVKLGKHLKAGAVVGYRAGYATLGSKLIFQL